MFRNIVSNINFSPALVGQLGFYANRLKKEEITRRIGLIFIILALVVQSFAILSPPESANASNGNNIIYGGIKNKDDLISMYDRNSDGAGHNDLQQIYSYFGISRQDIVNGSITNFNSRDQNLTISSVGRSTYEWQRDPHVIPGTSTTVYSSLLYKFDSLPYTIKNGSNYQALVGQRSSDGAWFAIMLDCGNPAYIELPPPPLVPSALCMSLSIVPINRTSYRLDGAAQVKDGGEITAFRYDVRDSSDSIVTSKRIATANNTSSSNIEIKKDGSYKVILTIETNIGEKTAVNCQKVFNVSPEPRCKLNPDFVESSPECKPCENDQNIWYKDDRCKSIFELDKKVKNITQLIEDANNTLAKASDTLEYRLTVKNTGNTTSSYSIKDNLGDVLEYSDLIDAGGGVINTSVIGTPVEDIGIINWPSTDIKPGQSITKVVIVRVKSSIPPTAQNRSNPESFNCRMVNDFAGNGTIVNVQCPSVKVVENVVVELPKTGTTENAIFGAIVLFIATYFYARTRQVKKEVRLIRRDLNSGSM